MRLTKTYADGTYGVADDLPCGENSHDFKKLLIDKLGDFETREAELTKEREANRTMREGLESLNDGLIVIFGETGEMLLERVQKITASILSKTGQEGNEPNDPI